MISHHLGTVISQSFAAPEQTFPSAASIMRLRSAYINAAKNGVTVLAGTGDAGATGARTLTPQGSRHLLPAPGRSTGRPPTRW